jgi:hypothetical protein
MRPDAHGQSVELLGRKGLGEHKLWCVSLYGYALVREYKAGQIYDAGASSGCELPSGVRQGLRVGPCRLQLARWFPSVGEKRTLLPHLRWPT